MKRFVAKGFKRTKWNDRYLGVEVKRHYRGLDSFKSFRLRVGLWWFEFVFVHMTAEDRAEYVNSIDSY